MMNYPMLRSVITAQKQQILRQSEVKQKLQAFIESCGASLTCFPGTLEVRRDHFQPPSINVESQRCWMIRKG